MFFIHLEFIFVFNFIFFIVVNCDYHCNFCVKRKYKVETEIENWIQKYDFDMGEKQVWVNYQKYVWFVICKL